MVKPHTFGRNSTTVLPQVQPSAARLTSYIIANAIEGVFMAKTIFVPLTDDLIYEHPERILGPVIPFSQRARNAAAGSVVFSSNAPRVNSRNEIEIADAGSAYRLKRSGPLG